MSIFIVSRTSTYSILSSDETYTLGQADSIDVNIGHGILLNGNIHSDEIDIEGEIHVSGDGLILYGRDNTITAGFDSIIAANIGVWLTDGSADQSLDGNVLVTKGQIDAVTNGIRSEVLGTSILNFGVIRADIAISASGFGITLVNADLARIEGGTWGISLTAITDSEQVSVIRNEGVISGSIGILGSSGRDLVTNEGTIVGGIRLGAGADVFDGRGGFVDGAIVGGDDNDTYLLDTAKVDLEEAPNGGTGDTVESAVSFSLPVNVENLILLGSGNTNGTGNSQANNIHGNAGKNLLRGLDGDDVLFGGKGDDRLIGGAGSDHFIFQKGSDRDTVRDFTTGGKQHDVIDLSDALAVENLSDLKRHHIDEHRGNLIIDIGHHGTITLLDVDMADLRAFDFHFADN